ncbi:MAG: class I SAM-dependent methyltransferase, partial [Pseudobdellovibrionaceae bacterium]
MAKAKYIHGFDPTEQKRLIDQAQFLEPYVYAGIDLEHKENLLEVGCGVGAQSKIMLRRFPNLKIDGLDISEAQLEAAKHYLKKEIKEKRVTLSQKDAQTFSLPKKNYDAAFLCWFLEHVPDPLKALKRVRQHLKPGAKIYCSEVFNQTLFIQPYSPAYLKYWFEFNDFQWSIGGHPFVGGMLGNYLKEAGFVDIQTEIRSFHFDSREPDRRKAFVDYFYQILLSAKDALIREGRVTSEMVKRMDAEVERVKKTRDSVFFYAWMRATARVPNK